MTDKTIHVSGYQRRDGVRVSAHTRRAGEPESEDGTGLEMPSIAPQDGVNIIHSRGESGKDSFRVRRGAKIIGGGGATSTGEQKTDGVKRYSSSGGRQ